MQKQKIFFGYFPNTDIPYVKEPTHEEKWKLINDTFQSFVGNEAAVRKVKTAAFTSLGRFNHVMQDINFAFFGPASSGKTTLGRLYAKVVDLPYLEISPKSIKTVGDLFAESGKVLEESGLPLCPIKDNHFVLPPMVIMIDEVHALSKGVVQGLLKATEHNDAQMNTEDGYYVNTKNVTWMIATTDEGNLFDAFRTRFSSVNLKYLSKEEIGRIISKSNPDLPEELCQLVAHYNSRIPRKALEFTRYMRMVKGMHPNKSWYAVARKVAKDEGIDEFGMHEIHLKILRALGKGPVAKNRMSIVSGRKDEETERYIMPWLLCETDDQPSLVTVGAKGYLITEAGREELIKRGIK